MKKITFQCTFLSDIVLKATGASEGRFQTLDYIPGSNFLGIVAKRYTQAISEGIAMDLFHNCNVRFGDAHMVLDNERSLKIPASWHFEKGTSLTDGVHLYNRMSSENRKKLTLNGIQLKQARQGYFITKPDSLIQINNSDSQYYAMKSAYDKTRRRAEDEKFFGYTALRRGTNWQFTVTITDTPHSNEILAFITDNLTQTDGGKHNIGLSRSAQYGRIQITKLDEKDVDYSTPEIVSGEIVLYAESRLAFLDLYGQPTLRIEPEMLNLPGSQINWEKSQILTSRYAPWNGKRRVQDADRICIDKGSVIVVDVTKGNLASLKSGVGYYKNDGFGELRINPEFLLNSDVDGKLIVPLHSSGNIFPHEPSNNESLTLSSHSQKVVSWLQKKQQHQVDNQKIFSLVNNFINEHCARFTGELSSQWGMVRSTAEQASNYPNLYATLFEKDGFLVDGVAKTKWQTNRRGEILRKFLEETEITDNLKIKLTIKLATEMAKHANIKYGGES